MNTPLDDGLRRPTSDRDDLAVIYRALKRGEGRDAVTDSNVGALIEMAAGDGNAQLELLLREWRSPCGDDADSPKLESRVPSR
jgi:hypothetical protein